MLSLTCDDQAGARQYFGKYAAIVVSYDDEATATAVGLDGDGRKRGEIIVDVPGILEEPDDAAPAPAGENGDEPPEEPPPRALRVVAKPSFMPGFFFIPEPGENVWVEFVAGDIDFPIWTGMWYPTKHPVVTVSKEIPTRHQRVIHTRSGHVVQLDDTQDAEKVVITHKTGGFLSIDKNGSVIIGNPNGSTVVLNAENASVVIVDESQNSVRMTEDGVVIVTADGKAAVTLSGDLARVTAKQIALEGTEVALGKDAADPTIVAAPDFVLKWNLFAAHTHLVPGVGASGPPLPTPGPLLGPGVGLSMAVTVK